jgi:hypothetical protein
VEESRSWDGLQPHDVERLAVEGDVTVVEFHESGPVLVLVEHGHPPLGEAEMVEAAGSM